MSATFTLQALADRVAVIDCVNAVCLFSDRRGWDRVAACFAPRVRLDYTSLGGGEPADRTPAEIVAGWRATLPGFDATQHIVANHQVTLAGDRAACLSHFRAQHRIGERIWELDGDYDHGLIRTAGGWRIDRMAMTWTFERGDRGLAAEASRRVAESSHDRA